MSPVSLFFPLDPLLFCVPPSFFFLFFFRQSSFYPCSVWCPPVGSAFHHPKPCSQETPVAPGAAPRCVFDRSCDLQQTCTRFRGRGKHVEGKILTHSPPPPLPCRLHQDSQAVHHEVTHRRAIYELAPNGDGETTHMQPLRNEMPPVG